MVPQRHRASSSSIIITIIRRECVVPEVPLRAPFSSRSVAPTITKKRRCLKHKGKRLDFPEKRKILGLSRDQDAAVDGRGVELFEGHDDGLARQPAQVSTQSPPKFGQHHTSRLLRRAARSFETSIEIVTPRPETAHGPTPLRPTQFHDAESAEYKMKMNIFTRPRASPVAVPPRSRPASTPAVFFPSSFSFFES